MKIHVTMLRIIFCLIAYVSASDYYVDIIDDGPVVVGANITFTANLYIKGGEQPKGTFKYKWRDNTVPQHRNETLSNAQSNWTISYSPEHFSAGSYKVEVEVFTPTIIIDWPECSKRKSFMLTSFMNGEMVLKQNNTSSASEYISNATTVTHNIKLRSPDAELLRNKASAIATYWYLDCNYIGKTNNLIFDFNYTTSDVTHIIDALVIASLESDHNSTNAVLHNTLSSAESSTEIDLINNSTKNNRAKLSNSTSSYNNTKFSYVTLNNGSNPEFTSPPIQYNCVEKTFSPINKYNIYGLFSRKIKVKAPVSNLRTEGINWLQHGEMLNLQVWCNGSAPFSYCVQFWNGNYSVTGNESCISKKMYLSTCNFQITHYFGNSTNYTVVIIVENDVQKLVRGVNVNVYEVTKHAQLSVIIVPISASIVAVILIVFGIAYYVQSRHRYIVEVADFDFSNASDMEYKTFRERLVEAVSNAFNKTEDYSEQDSSNGVPASKKYGSMQ